MTNFEAFKAGLTLALLSVKCKLMLDKPTENYFHYLNENHRFAEYLSHIDSKQLGEIVGIKNGYYRASGIDDTAVMGFFRSAFATDSNAVVLERICDLMNEKSGIDTILAQAFGRG